ncbi:OTU (ovarian tumor)-like cysteine protease [Phytophthora cinnamomi]|uniref:OTU (ovarian tumor)-like cysteine protease n=1 Tax=Phytophthora cinnamomi TaxID=4785 RepID=UPI003559FA37|nr:OTU (ovarian tumor)-like cysteine protease [Phytophthora cinnamomi]
MTAPSSPPAASGRASSRFSLRSSAKAGKKRSHKGVRFWFSSSPKPSDTGHDLAEDAAAAAREVDAELDRTKPRTESTSSYVPRVEYGSPRCGAKERDAAWSSNEQVDAHYAALGWTLVPISKDGNCLFRAISEQLYTSEHFHQDIRRRLVDFIERDQQLFKPFIEDEEVADYCARLRQDGQWGGHLELYAAAKLFNIHFVVHTGPVRRLRVTNEDDGDGEKQHPPAPPPYRILHLLFKDDHYSSLHSNEEVKTVTPEEYTVVPDESTDKRARSPTKAYDSPDKKSVKYQVTPISKVVSIQDLARKSVTASDPSRKTVKFEEVVEAKPPPREGKACIYEEEDVPECGVFLPKQVLFRRGKRRVSGATLFSLVHVPSSSNLSPVAESPSTSESSSSSYASTASVSSSSSQEQENWSETKPPPVPPRPKATAPTLRAVPVEFPSKAVFHKGRATTAAC